LGEKKSAHRAERLHNQNEGGNGEKRGFFVVGMFSKKMAIRSYQKKKGAFFISVEKKGGKTGTTRLTFTGKGRKRKDPTRNIPHSSERISSLLIRTKKEQGDNPCYSPYTRKKGKARRREAAPHSNQNREERKRWLFRCGGKEESKTGPGTTISRLGEGGKGKRGGRDIK